MSKTIFSISDLLEISWVKFKEKTWFWIGLTILTGLVGSLGNVLDVNAETFEIENLNVLGLLGWGISLYVSASVTLIAIKFMRGEHVSFEDLRFIDFTTFIHYFLATIFSTFFIAIGFICFIIPGFYIMSRLIFVQYLVVDKSLSFDQAIKTSWVMSDGYVLQFISFFCALFLVLLVGLFAFLVGLLVSVPITMLASAQLYLLFSQDSILEIE